MEKDRHISAQRPFNISPHAVKSIAERAIPLHVIETVLKSPQQIVESGERKVYQSIFLVYGNKMLVRVVVAELENHNEVVTAYRTSNIKKYWVGEVENIDES